MLYQPQKILMLDVSCALNKSINWL